MNGYYLTLGDRNVSMSDPQPGQIDIPALEERLKHIHRFSNNPSALSVDVHERFVAVLCKADPLDIVPDAMRKDCIAYAEKHDHPEALIGDIPGPLKKYLVANGNLVLRRVEMQLGNCVLRAYGMQPPCAQVRNLVEVYDKVAEALEWRYVLLNPFAEWCRPEARTIDGKTARKWLAAAL